MTEKPFLGFERPPSWPGYNSRNMNALALKLWTLPEETPFTMSRGSPNGPEARAYGMFGNPLPHETVRQYVDRTLLRKISFAPRYAWCFSPNWLRTDNTAKGCAQRIFMLVSEGMPRDWAEQVMGKAPLSYTHLIPDIVVPEDEPQYEGGQFEFSRVSLEEKKNKAKEKG